MAGPPNMRSHANDSLEQVEVLAGTFGDVFARSFATYTWELFKMMEGSGLHSPLLKRLKSEQDRAEDLLASEPDWVKEAYENAQEVTEGEEFNVREVRGRLIRDRLILALRKQRMTQADLARKLKKQPSQISRIFRDPTRCRLSTFEDIASALKVDLSDILKGFGRGD